MKKPFAVLLAIFLLLFHGSASATARGLDSKGVAVLTRISKFDSIYPTLRTSGNTASYSLSAAGKPEVTSISATLQIQQLVNGAYVDYGSPWNATSNSRTLKTSGTKTVDNGGTYRLKVTVTAYYPGGSSTETEYSL